MLAVGVPAAAPKPVWLSAAEQRGTRGIFGVAAATKSAWVIASEFNNAL
jgi:hypothetical protein